MTEKNKVLAYLILNGKLLVFQQKKYPEAGLQIPAGTIEAGESPEEAVIREVKEETGLQNITIVRKLGVEVLDMRPFKKQLHRRHAFLISVNNTDDSARWIHLEDTISNERVGSVMFSFFWKEIEDNDLGLIAGHGNFLGEIRNNKISSFIRKEVFPVELIEKLKRIPDKDSQTSAHRHTLKLENMEMLEFYSHKVIPDKDNIDEFITFLIETCGFKHLFIAGQPIEILADQKLSKYPYLRCFVSNFLERLFSVFGLNLYSEDSSNQVYIPNGEFLVDYLSLSISIQIANIATILKIDRFNQSCILCDKDKFLLQLDKFTEIYNQLTEYKLIQYVLSSEVFRSLNINHTQL